MSLSYGFFNSYNGDRVYNAEQFSSFLDGIVYDGVYQAVGNKFFVRAAPGLMVTIDTGRAWFDHTWILNNTLMTLALPVADTVYPRIDAVVIEVNHENRENYIKIVEGTAKVNPMRPTLVKTDFVKQWALAYVTIPANATSISQSNIVNVVDTAETPLASALALAGIPSGGKIGQVLAKKSSESGAVDWYDPDKLPYDIWYLAEGINESHVLGAYGFKNAGTEEKALKNINEKTNFPLVKSSASVVFDNSKGFIIPGKEFLNNETLRQSNAVTVAFKFTDITNMNGAFCLHGGHVSDTEGYNDNTAIYINAPWAVEHWNAYTNPHFAINAKGAGVDMSWDPETESSISHYNSNNYREAASTRTSPGVLSASFHGGTLGDLYFNGTKLGLSPIQATGEITESGRGYLAKLIGGNIDYYAHWVYTTLTIQCAVFYNITLNDSQHAQLYRQFTSAFG